MSRAENSINYIELPMTDPEPVIMFYETVFGWHFQRWGADYISFEGAGIDGGFNGQDKLPVSKPGTLVILYSKELEKKRDQIKAAGGKIIRDIYPFPGGRRFHFEDPAGNELGVWSEKA
ncbi:VOC family protein [Ponticaulis profundi]|uniref:VOC family protein n=1 Tax=Ponticaulis profundi TaxID=2665222 RepID=A0ABW1S7F5_9PROT